MNARNLTTAWIASLAVTAILLPAVAQAGNGRGGIRSGGGNGGRMSQGSHQHQRHHQQHHHQHHGHKPHIVHQGHVHHPQVFHHPHVVVTPSFHATPVVSQPIVVHKPVVVSRPTLIRVDDGKWMFTAILGAEEEIVQTDVVIDSGRLFLKGDGGVRRIGNVLAERGRAQLTLGGFDLTGKAVMTFDGDQWQGTLVDDAGRSWDVRLTKVG